MFARRICGKVCSENKFVPPYHCCTKLHYWTTVRRIPKQSRAPLRWNQHQSSAEGSVKVKSSAQDSEKIIKWAKWFRDVAKFRSVLLLSPLVGFMWYSVEEAPYTKRKRIFIDIFQDSILAAVQWTEGLFHSNKHLSEDTVPTDDLLHTRIATTIGALCDANQLETIPTDFSIYTSSTDPHKCGHGALTFHTETLNVPQDEVTRLVARELSHIVLQHRQEQAFSFMLLVSAGFVGFLPYMFTPRTGLGGHVLTFLVPAVGFVFFKYVYWKMLEEEADQVAARFVEAVGEQPCKPRRQRVEREYSF